MSNSNCVFLDTSFILYMDDSHPGYRGLKEKILYLLSLFYGGDITVYISNLVINELYHNCEKIGYEGFLAKSATEGGACSIENYQKMIKADKEKIRKKYAETNNITLKTWRKEPRFSTEYKSNVTDYFNNLFTNLKGMNIEYAVNYKSLTGNEVINKIIATKNKYKNLDTTDINHYLISINYNIKHLVTCDSDFNVINENEFGDINVINLFSMPLRNIEKVLGNF